MADAILEFKQQNIPLVSIRTLGRFDVLKEGHSLVIGSSGSKKIWELYKFMLTHRDKSFTPESLMDQLWVSEEYNDLRSTLRRQMHRLKQTLREEDCTDQERTMLFSNGYYRWNDKLNICLDIEIFEALVKEGDAVKSSEPLRALGAYQEALSHYHGDYLPDCLDQLWVFPIRNHYKRLFVRTVLNTMELLKDLERFDDILLLCHKAIRIDIYEESFHLSMMEALLEKGDTKQALEHYEYITAFYYREMGIKPSVEMRAVYKRLLKNQNLIKSDNGLQDVLESGVSLENAFYCDVEVFRSIYELERRRSQRSGESFSIGVLTMTSNKGYTPSQAELRQKNIKELLLERLRKGDTFTRWNDQQFVVLLPGVDSVLTEKVLQRVLRQETERGTIAIGHIAHLVAEPFIRQQLDAL